ncbi:hypothetical protein D9611_002860 [Ephemerocybe angulata]|uniref:3-keto sterol reductase n=1 Tax=Ephemerocybe angulata TaxID=980116 RepID=A0A8H5C9C2_9AGAR|nr:hypothetical protein D9611_002860 [Tulosesus angulatus]
MTRPIIIVTGANGGLGYGICQRLLVQLSTPSPPDALPQPFEEALPPREEGKAMPKYTGATVIMACRSVARAEKARGELLKWFDAHLRKRIAKGGVDKAAEEFRKNLVVEVEYLDLASTKSVFDFAARIRSRYTYISHLMCNAGLASFTGIDWALAIKQLLASPMQAVTAPLFYSQHQGELSIDGLGWVWQCNFFGHFALFRELENLLAASSPSSNAISVSASPPSSAVKAGDIEGLGAGRVVWCSSIEASPAFYDPADWQLKNTTHSYESSKYQIDIVATTLDRLSTHPTISADSEPKSSNPTNASRNGSGRVRHFVSQPGVVNTNVANALIGPFFDMIKICLFYLARWLGSPNHPISPYKGALAATHLALVPLACLALLTSAPPPPPSSSQSKAKSKASASSEGKGGNSSSKSSKGYPRVPPVRFGSETDRWGEERVGLSPVKAWLANEEEGRRLVLACDALLRKCKEEEGRGWVGENASERM